MEQQNKITVTKTLTHRISTVIQMIPKEQAIMEIARHFACVEIAPRSSHRINDGPTTLFSRRR
ncbi:MAG: hypothetical protein M9899_05090 [Bdellovibrionaceae bacterium]|nr:hypothetical protein [Pseudobdellovibrionaceae bacterium]